jgi:hypothetical protein
MDTSAALQVIETYDPRTAGLVNRQYVFGVPNNAPSAFVAKTPGGTPVYLNVDASGNLMVTGGGGGGGSASPSGTIGDGFPTVVSPVGFRSSSGNLVALALQADGSVPVTVVTGGTAKSTTSTVATVGASVTSVTLLAANAARKGATVYNTSTSWLFVRLGAVANTTSGFSAKLPPEGYLELPFGWTGLVDGIWLSAVGGALVTELT